MNDQVPADSDMQPSESDLMTTSRFAQDVVQVTELCNNYLASQTSEHAEAAKTASVQLVEDYGLSKIPHIVLVVDDLKKLITDVRWNDALAEAAIIDEIRRTTDVVEAKNLVLTFNAGG